MPARAPDEVHRLFTQYFTAGDIDALVSLYEPTAVLLPQPGQKVSGHAAIREALAAFLAMNGKFQMAPPKVIQATDVAIVFAEWTLSALAADGSPIRLSGHTSDVVRRQPDGRWLLAIDSPFGAAGAGG
jgi:uncharacterized protein (TIGR02246 family)